LWRTLGGVIRRTGQALDSLGVSLQGKYGVKDQLSRHRTLLPYEGARPKLGYEIFVAPNASVIGNVTLGDRSSVWYGAILRGDVNSIEVGDNTNLQDGVVVHVAKTALGPPSPTSIGSNVTIGHAAMIHACTIEDGSLVGMGATLCDGCKVEKGAIVAAGALVTPGTVVPSGEVWAGRPAKLLRKLEEGEAEFIARSADNYALLAAQHAEENAKTFPELEADKARRRDRALRDPDYDSHLGLMRDAESREIITVAQHT